MKTVVFLLLLFFSLPLFSQTYQFRTQSVAFRQYPNDWGDWQTIDIVIIIDAPTSRLIVQTEEYLLIDELERKNDPIKSSIMFTGLTKGGEMCTIEIIYFIERKVQQFYIRWPEDHEIVYQTVRI